MKLGLYKAKLIKQTKAWHKHLENNVLLVGKLFDSYKLINFNGDFNTLCKTEWKNELEHQYDTLSIFQQEVALGNDGFWFEPDELEITSEL